MPAIATAIDVLFQQVLALRPGERVLVLGDEVSPEGLAAEVRNHAATVGAHGEVCALPCCDTFYVNPTDEIARKMRQADVLLELSSCSLYYSQTMRSLVSSGKRIYFLTGIGPAEFERLMPRVNHEEIHALGQRIRALLLRSKTVEIFSGPGCGLQFSLGSPRVREFIKLPLFRRCLNTFFDEPTGLCRKPGTLSSLAGQVSFSGIRASMRGRIRVDGAVFPPQIDCPLEEPLEIRVRSGRVVDVETTPAGVRLAKWIHGRSSQGAREVMHFSFGLNPAVTLGGSILFNERAFGAVTVGLGYGAMNAHTDLVMAGPSVWIDGQPLFIEGRLVHPEVVYFPRALHSRGF